MINIKSKPKTLEVSGLYKKYHKKTDYVIKDINFKCDSGEIVGLLGANGAGKSTTLKCITGMIPITHGQIKIAGFDIEKQPIDAKTHFSFVTDNHLVFVKMTGIQYLKFMADVYKIPNDKRDTIIQNLENIFKLGDKINQLISSYSHGMKQKICMMGSLIHSPDLWILDEPLTGLDPSTQNSVMRFMENYVKGGKTILFSSHNLDIVSRICDRILIINNGILSEKIKNII